MKTLVALAFLLCLAASLAFVKAADGLVALAGVLMACLFIGACRGYK